MSSNNIYTIKDAGKIDVLVNKKRNLPANYIPADLVNVEVLNYNVEVGEPKPVLLRKEASDALTALFNGAKLKGFEFWAVSGFRSYERQVYIFNYKAKIHGEEQANRFSARPGQSEHQTGLTMDVSLESLDYKLLEELGETPEGIWLASNAHNYGFIVRYQKGKEHITGYKYEPWHIRYLGKELAAKVYDSKLTYDEYCERQDISYL